MYIIQIADLHINESFDFKYFKTNFDALVKQYNLADVKEKIVVCILGDIIDMGDASNFKKAERVMDYIVAQNMCLEFVPGNHDIVNGSLKEFNMFIHRYVPYTFEGSNTIVRNYEDIELILLNSVYHCDYTYGKIDIEELKNVNTFGKSICMMHHTILSENDNDKSALRNAYHFLETLNEKNVVGILHGHTHGYKDIVVNKNCLVIGVGPFLKEVANVNNQCNFLRVTRGIIDYVSNCRYNADLNKYVCLEGQSQVTDNYFCFDSIYSAHQAVIRNLELKKSCINMHMKVDTSFESFRKEINAYYREFMNDAKDWLSLYVPDSLYYNHGSFMISDNSDGVSYVIEELKRKKTSSRAIIPLINFNDVINRKDTFLPSFNILQFGFYDKKEGILYANLYMRDVEVNNFLYINICELYLIIEKISKELGLEANDQVSINIFSFRAQYKQKFGCFRKARLDRMTEADLTVLVQGKRKKTLLDIISEKMELHETIIQDKGFVHLKNAFQAICYVETDNEKMKNAVSEICEILDNLNEIKYLRAITNDTETKERELNRHVLSLKKLIEEM